MTNRDLFLFPNIKIDCLIKEKEKAVFKINEKIYLQNCAMLGNAIDTFWKNRSFIKKDRTDQPPFEMEKRLTAIYNFFKIQNQNDGWNRNKGRWHEATFEFKSSKNTYRDQGRIFPHEVYSDLQTINRECRSFLIQGTKRPLYRDIDMKSCHHSLLSHFILLNHIVDKDFFETSILKKYIINREELWKEQVNLKVEKELFKKLMVTIMYGGNVPSEFKHSKNVFFQFKKEIDVIYNNLKDIQNDSLKTIFNEVNEKKGGFNSWAGVLSIILTAMESAIILSVVKTIQDLFDKQIRPTHSEINERMDKCFKELIQNELSLPSLIETDIIPCHDGAMIPIDAISIFEEDWNVIFLENKIGQSVTEFFKMECQVQFAEKPLGLDLEQMRAIAPYSTDETVSHIFEKNFGIHGGDTAKTFSQLDFLFDRMVKVNNSMFFKDQDFGYWESIPIKSNIDKCKSIIRSLLAKSTLRIGIDKKENPIYIHESGEALNKSAGLILDNIKNSFELERLFFEKKDTINCKDAAIRIEENGDLSIILRSDQHEDYYMGYINCNASIISQKKKENDFKGCDLIYQEFEKFLGKEQTDHFLSLLYMILTGNVTRTCVFFYSGRASGKSKLSNFIIQFFGKFGIHFLSSEWDSRRKGRADPYLDNEYFIDLQGKMVCFSAEDTMKSGSLLSRDTIIDGTRIKDFVGQDKKYARQNHQSKIEIQCSAVPFLNMNELPIIFPEDAIQSILIYKPIAKFTFDPQEVNPKKNTYLANPNFSMFNVTKNPFEDFFLLLHKYKDKPIVLGAIPDFMKLARKELEERNPVNAFMTEFNYKIDPEFGARNCGCSVETVKNDINDFFESDGAFLQAKNQILKHFKDVCRKTKSRNIVGYDGIETTFTNPVYCYPGLIKIQKQPFSEEDE